MASVLRRGRTFYARWKDSTGRQRRSATACTSKKDAQRFAEDLERKAERQRRGLEPREQAPAEMTFGDLFDWWMREYGSQLRGEFEGFLRKRLVCRLEGIPIQGITSARIEGLLQSQSGELAPKSLNELRGYVSTIFARAAERGLWHGDNPASAVRKRKVDRKVFDTLRAEEVPLLLNHLPDEWRPLFATAIWTGMRKGELLGLQKSDIDMVAGVITIRRSYDHETTKGRRADPIPTATPLRPYLASAMLASPSEHVFPAADGSMRPPTTNLRGVLERALMRAGLVLGHRHRCRQGCGHQEQATDRTVRLCPKCKAKLRSKAIPRRLRFHDLRGTTATLLARAGYRSLSRRGFCGTPIRGSRRTSTLASISAI